jgi:hypothetical protein
MDEKEELRKINEQVFVDEIADVSEEARQAMAKLMADRLCDEIADAYDLAGEDITTGADNDSVVDDGPIDMPTTEDLSTDVHDQGVLDTTGMHNTAIGEENVAADYCINEAMKEPQELERVTAPSVKSSAARVGFTCGTWTAKKTDKKGTKQVEQINQVKNVGEFKKSLMSDNLALKQLKYYSGKARNKHYEMTMAFGGNNEYIIPTVDLPAYIKAISEIRNKFYDWKDKFMNGYTDSNGVQHDGYRHAVIDEKLRLGSLHNSGDYPSVSDMDAKFHMSYTIDEIPDSFITDLEENAAKQINDIYQEQHKARMKKFSDAVWTETRNNIERLRDALSYTGESKKTNPDFKIFKDSTYTHVQRTVEVLERFNFTGDANMQTVQKILRDAMSGKSADMLKHNESLRLDTKKALDDAIANLPSLDI